MWLRKSAYLTLALAAACACAQQPAAAPTAGPAITKSGTPLNPHHSDGESVASEALPCPAPAPGQQEAAGIQRVGGSVKPPRLLNNVVAEFSDSARKQIKKQHLKNFQAVSVLSLIVDADGNPREVCVRRQAGYGLDEQAIKAANRYRFAPATRDGSPVAVRISVEVNFRMN